jgi:hypothetical protein
MRLVSFGFSFEPDTILGFPAFALYTCRGARAVPELDFTTYLRASIYGLAILKCGPWLDEGQMHLGQRREFITMLGCAAVPPMASRAEQVGKTYRIGLSGQ